MFQPSVEDIRKGPSVSGPGVVGGPRLTKGPGVVGGPWLTEGPGVVRVWLVVGASCVTVTFGVLCLTSDDVTWTTPVLVLTIAVVVVFFLPGADDVCNKFVTP